MVVFSGRAISWNHSCPQALVGITVVYSASICVSTVQTVRKGTVSQRWAYHQGAYHYQAGNSVVRLLMELLFWLWNHLKIRKNFRLGFVSLTRDLIMS